MSNAPSAFATNGRRASSSNGSSATSAVGIAELREAFATIAKLRVPVHDDLAIRHDGRLLPVVAVLDRLADDSKLLPLNLCAMMKLPRGSTYADGVRDHRRRAPRPPRDSGSCYAEFR